MENQINKLDYELLMQAYVDKCKEVVNLQILATKQSIEIEEFKNKENLKNMEKDLKGDKKE